MSEKSPGSVPLFASPPRTLPQTQFEGLPIRLSLPFTCEYAARMARSSPSELFSRSKLTAPLGATSRKLSEQAYITVASAIVLHVNLFLNIFFIVVSQ